MSFASRDDVWTVSDAFRQMIMSAGATVMRRPAVAGVGTAIVVASTFVTANAVMFQERSHPSAFFATRPVVDTASEPARSVESGGPNVTRFLLDPKGDTEPQRQPETPAAELPRPKPAPVALRPAEQNPADAEVMAAVNGADGADDSVFKIQELLAELGYYDGPLDGLQGPMTQTAIETYKRKAGLRGIELTDAELITSMRNNMNVTSAIPESQPETEAAAADDGGVDNVEEAIARAMEGPIPSAEVVKVQAALKAFGNTDVSVDGIAGPQTKSAIREFQTLFKLEPTGEIDDVLITKMREVGLVQ